jgi:hypothetical protein
MSFSKFETDVIQKILDSDGNLHPKLQEQVKLASVKDREYTGVGFFLYFKFVSSVLPLGKNPSFVLSNVAADIKGLEHGATFSLWIENGLLYMLEGKSMDGKWIKDITQYNLYYIKGSSE